MGVVVGRCRQQAQWREGIPLAAARVEVRGRSGFGVVPGDALLRPGMVASWRFLGRGLSEPCCWRCVLACFVLSVKLLFEVRLIHVILYIRG